MISLRSDITKKILSYFFINPENGLYVNELSRKLKLDKRNLVKKIRQFEAQGLLKSQVRGNLKIYSINKSYPFYKEYKKIILSTIGLEDRLKEILKKVRGIKEAYLYGSFARARPESHSDIDLLVIGSHDVMELQKRLSPLQHEIDREINAVNMDERELEKRKANQDPYILNIFGKKHVRLI